ncbi:hypothetical protein ACFE04_000371 [Oxalis oulophora]
MKKISSLSREPGILKLIHPGNKVDIHTKPIIAAEVMKKHPRSCVTRPDVFKYPWIVVNPDSVLKLGRVYFLVPWHTIRGLLKKHGLPENYHSSPFINSQELGNFPVQRAKLSSWEDLWADEQELNTRGGCCKGDVSISTESMMEFSRFMKNLEVSKDSVKHELLEKKGHCASHYFRGKCVSSSPVRNKCVLENSYGNKSPIERKKKSPVKLNRITPLSKYTLESSTDSPLKIRKPSMVTADLEINSGQSTYQYPRKEHPIHRIRNLAHYKNSPKLGSKPEITRSNLNVRRALQPMNGARVGVNNPRPVTELKSCLKKNGSNLAKPRSLKVKFYIPNEVEIEE